ncbi:5-methylthioadenosine/S-adenosylhomocysteine deaminase [Sporomusaceae bacterium BoRhaA]|uniref:amidohydrolase n=1 Tax=Pelorhabdus rhamnosifermentans TaxID=2772457 RepID=UPI001C060FEF|nr:amidohydrolase [Pelorhabdus rhamnosifermentans]MBU2700361.1 5-methylthioadenosine/S-adenosylhomocysteine deaminase [Pelorhabdus rhamnosifermentans]
MSRILIKQAEVLDSQGLICPADIAIDQGKIVGIGNYEFWSANKVIDGKDKLAIPGFINTHTHAAMTLFRSYADDMLLMDWLENKIWPAEDKLTPADVYWGTMLAIVEMIQSGTTTFSDMYFHMDEVARAVEESGIRGVLARGMAGVAPNGEQALKDSEDFFNNWNHKASGRITVMLGPHAPYTCPPAYLKKVVALADKLNAPIHIHLSETQGEVADCLKEYGLSPIALMEQVGILDHPVLAAHCVHVSDADIALMKAHSVKVAHNPGSNMKLASGIAPVPKLLEQGIVVGLGTDGTASNNNLDMIEEMRLAALLHKTSSLDPLVIPAKQAVNMATEQGAKCLGLEKVIGTLKEGYEADVVLLDMHKPNWYPRHDRLSLLTYAASAGDVDTVIVQGKILMYKRQMTHLDVERILFENQVRGLRLVQNSEKNS